MNKDEAEAVIRDTVNYANQEIAKVRKRYRKISLISIVAIILVCVFVYFMPLSFSNIVREDRQVAIIMSEIGVQNGEPYIDSTEYQNLTANQNSAVLNTLKEHTYQRTLGTLFSDGTMYDLGNSVLYIYVYDNNWLISSVAVSSTGEISVNAKTYRMKNAEQFIEHIIEIMKQAD